MSDRIAENWAGSVPADVIGGAQRDLRSSGGETLALALELAWLADVLPAVAAGDYRSFNTTGTMQRRMLRQNGSMVNQLLTAQTRNEMNRLMNVLGAQFEDQLVAVAASMR